MKGVSIKKTLFGRAYRLFVTSGETLAPMKVEEATALPRPSWVFDRVAQVLYEDESFDSVGEALIFLVGQDAAYRYYPVWLGMSDNLKGMKVNEQRELIVWMILFVAEELRYEGR